LFQNQTVLITGGSSGINLGIARNFAAVGANLGLCGRSQDKLDAASAELRALGARVSAHAADVRDYAALETAMRHVKETLGPIHTLVGVLHHRHAGGRRRRPESARLRSMDAVDHDGDDESGRAGCNLKMIIV
jgi:NADP-dependent 3-hydroxy acid dehydrogenase YdfG